LPFSNVMWHLGKFPPNTLVPLPAISHSLIILSLALYSPDTGSVVKQRAKKNLKDVR
jgi:hypothetical protein